MDELSLNKLQRHFLARTAALDEPSIDHSSYRLAAVLILIYPGKQGLELILTRRTEHLPHHAGQVSLPGGSVDATDDSHYKTALREAREEIGIIEKKIAILGSLPVALLPSGFAVTPVVGLMDHVPRLQAEPNEVAEIFSIPLALVLNIALYKRNSLLRDGIKREFFFFDYKDNYIWGATAGILRSLAIELQASS